MTLRCGVIHKVWGERWIVIKHVTGFTDGTLLDQTVTAHTPLTETPQAGTRKFAWKYMGKGVPNLAEVKLFNRKAQFSKEGIVSAVLGEKKREGEACPYCGKVYFTPNGFDEHVNKHRGIYRYICDICNKGFQKRDHYEGHTNTHLNRKPFECPGCRKAFSYRHCLLRHQKIC